MTKERWDKIKDRYPQFTKAEFEWIIYALNQAAWQNYFDSQRATNVSKKRMLMKHSNELADLFKKLFPTKEQEIPGWAKVQPDPACLGTFRIP